MTNSPRRFRVPLQAAALLALGLVLLPAAAAASGASLEDELGRNDTRVRSAAFPLVAGMDVQAVDLAGRLDRRGYTRVHDRPERPGQYFWGHERFWIWQHAHRLGGRDYADSLIGLDLDRGTGAILSMVGKDDDRGVPLDREGLAWLEPVTLAESLNGGRAARVPIDLDRLPDNLWRALLAAEDVRFFGHAGVDARAIARAALANVNRGEVAQGGSTITQQLIKNRDLTPRRSLGRKVSEAVRALVIEAEYDKREILEAYLERVYYGHVDGLAVHGIGAAARVWFSRDATRLTLPQAALLAAMVQGPNRLNPVRHPERVRERRDWVLERMAGEGWITEEARREAQAAPLGIDISPPRPEGPGQFLAWLAAEVADEAPKRADRDRGFVVETTLDPWLQELAETTVAHGLDALRRRHGRLAAARLSAALVALDAETGAVLAWVGGDAAARERFDRVGGALRQPGSTVKPFTVLEALDDCGRREALHAASRVADQPLRVELDSGAWEPTNFDRRYLGVVDVREALAGSRNVPLVRIARWCGFDAVARTFDRAGLELPADPPPSFVLGAVETTPLALAGAYTVFATPGVALEPFAWTRIEKPGGRRLARERRDGRRVTDEASAWLVRNLLRGAVEDGTARGAAIGGLDVAGKTGSSSDLRDAWFAGDAGSVVAVVWVGLDDGAPLGLTGAQAAVPLWRAFMTRAAPARPPRRVERPWRIFEAAVDPDSGLRVDEDRRGAEAEAFRRGAAPRRNRFWRVDPAEPVIQ